MGGKVLGEGKSAPAAGDDEPQLRVVVPEALQESLDLALELGARKLEVD